MARYVLPAILALFAAPALADGPYCAVEETCTGTADNCQPAEGRLDLLAQPSGKAHLVLNGATPVVATPLMLGQMMQLIATDPDGTQHQLRVAPDGAFNYLINTPDETEFNGKNQILYRGTCVEG